ncbi:MAG: hypothetical protein J5934_07675 [Succinivibrio sp.]|nr:hypothetical protein [Succinivibrio sp.]
MDYIKYCMYEYLPVILINIGVLLLAWLFLRCIKAEWIKERLKFFQGLLFIAYGILNIYVILSGRFYLPPFPKLRNPWFILFLIMVGLFMCMFARWNLKHLKAQKYFREHPAEYRKLLKKMKKQRSRHYNYEDEAHASTDYIYDPYYSCLDCNIYHNDDES